MASVRPTFVQVESLVDFLEQNPGIAKGLVRTSQAKAETKRKWEEFAVTANALGGAVKNALGWAKYWAEKKCTLKKACAVINLAHSRTGGGVERIPQLTILDKRLVAIMGGPGFAVGDSALAVDPFPALQPAFSHCQSGDAEEVVVFRVVEETVADSPTLSSPTPRPPSVQTGTPQMRTRRNSQIPVRQRLSRGLDGEMERLAKIEEKRVEAEAKTAEAFSSLASSLQENTAALNNIAAAMYSIASAIGNLSLRQ